MPFGFSSFWWPRFSYLGWNIVIGVWNKIITTKHRKSSRGSRRMRERLGSVALLFTPHPHTPRCCHENVIFPWWGADDQKKRMDSLRFSIHPFSLLSVTCFIFIIHNAKKTLHVIISGKIPENYVHKSCMYMLIFDVHAQIFFPPIARKSLGHIWAKISKNVTPLTPQKWPKMAAYEPKMAKTHCEKLQLNFFNFSRRATGFEIWPFKVEIAVRANFSLYL